MTIQEKINKLEKEKREALLHVVGTSYYMEVAKQKEKEIQRLLKVKQTH